MQYRTVIERIGEKVGEIDWSYDFFADPTHYNCSPPEYRRGRIQQHVESLREIERLVKGGKSVQFRDSSDYWRDVIDTGMYDGWPYWVPTPAVLRREPVLGGVVWDFWYDIRDVRVAAE